MAGHGHGPEGNGTVQADLYRQLLLGTGTGSAAHERKGGKDWNAHAAAAGDDAGNEDIEEGVQGGFNEGAQDMEVSFVPGLDKLGQRLAAQKQAAAKKGSETVWNAYLRKRREKRMKAKALGSRLGSSNEDSSDGEAVPSATVAEHDAFFQHEADPFDDPFFQDAAAPARAAPDDEASDGAEETLAEETGNIGHRSHRHKGNTAAAAGNLPMRKGRLKERPNSKEERQQAAQAEEQRRAELELLLMDDTALKNPSQAGRQAQTASMGPASKGKVSRKERIRAKKAAKTLARQADSDEDDLALSGKHPVTDAPDPRFQQLFTSPDYALDPTNPLFKQTQAIQAALGLSVSDRRQPRHSPEPIAEPVQMSIPPSDGPSHSQMTSVKGMVASLKRKAKAKPESSASQRFQAKQKVAAG